MAQMVKNLPAMQETCSRSLDWENPLEKEMVTHSSIIIIFFNLTFLHLFDTAEQLKYIGWVNIRLFLCTNAYLTGFHSSILAWRIPRTEEPGRLLSTRSQKSWT